jgi:hypothetical protein
MTKTAGFSLSRVSRQAVECPASNSEMLSSLCDGAVGVVGVVATASRRSHQAAPTVASKAAITASQSQSQRLR